jgi:squalene-hopene/tetraprenyl-beta-curcumene cyclase
MRIAAVALASLAIAAGCRRTPPLETRIDAALARGVDFLLAQQRPDGSWRSETYGTLKDGWALTASLAKALVFAPETPAIAAARERALAFLASAARDDGTIDTGESGLPYPVYTAALAVIAFTRADSGRAPRYAGARDAWLALLESHPLDEHLGWTEADWGYGGWGYSVAPHRRGAGDSTFEADLSSTLFALGALRVAGRDASDPAVRRALIFVERCQNLPCAGEPSDPERDDGGFFMTPCDAFQNKAGGSELCGGTGRPRSRSYGSMTADGVRALLRCGVPANDARVTSALAWIAQRFDPKVHAGEFEPQRLVERDSAWFYASWSTAHALFELGVRELDTRRGRVRWAEELAEEVLRRQAPDGSWRNAYKFVQEDDPLVATPFALAALALARTSLEFAH